MICANCGTANEAGRKFCKECASPLSVVCSNCGTANAPDAKFCGECASALSLVTGVGSVSRPPLDAPLHNSVAERRVVTVLFADLVGFTAFAEERDAEEVRDTLSRYFELATEVVVRYGGVIEKFIGDAVMAVWGAPAAHEDDAERAVRAGLELVGSVHLLAPSIQARAGEEGAIGGGVARVQRSRRGPGRSVPRRRLTGGLTITGLQQSLERLEAYLVQERFRGYDPYDALTSPLFRLPILRSSKWFRIAGEQALKRSPLNLRPLLRIPKGYNPVTLALVLEASAHRALAEPERERSTGSVRPTASQSCTASKHAVSVGPAGATTFPGRRATGTFRPQLRRSLPQVSSPMRSSSLTDCSARKRPSASAKARRDLCWTICPASPAMRGHSVRAISPATTSVF